jgi:hypothetical protein
MGELFSLPPRCRTKVTQKMPHFSCACFAVVDALGKYENIGRGLS